MAKGKDKGGKGGPEDSKDAARKADFSAYWSLKVRQWFSSRRDYLEGAESQPDKQPELLRKLSEAIEQQSKVVQQADEAEHASRMQRAEASMAAAKAADEAAANILKPLESALLKGGMPAQPELSPMQRVELDAKVAREYLHTPAVSGLVLTLYRVQQVARGLLMLPFTLSAAVWQGWHDLFASQRYEQFLMSEGERVWGWRNRTENERWFWEIFAWDRLLFPLLCVVAYEYVVPAHLVWVAVVPAMFIMWQTGKLPGPGNMEFWAIAYFGVYKRCWGDVLGLARALFVWA